MIGVTRGFIIKLIMKDEQWTNSILCETEVNKIFSSYLIIVYGYEWRFGKDDRFSFWGEGGAICNLMFII